MSEHKLKLCPFCGGEASIGTVKYSPCDITKLNNREKGYFINCQICSARNEHGISYATEEEAIQHWNTRNCHDGLVAACEDRIATTILNEYLDWAKHMKESPSLAVYREQFGALCALLNDLIYHSDRIKAALAKVKKEEIAGERGEQNESSK